jgi:hypothetical protein
MMERARPHKTARYSGDTTSHEYLRSRHNLFQIHALSGMRLEGDEQKSCKKFDAVSKMIPRKNWW